MPGAQSGRLVAQYGALPVLRGGAPQLRGDAAELLEGRTPETFEAAVAALIGIYAFAQDTPGFRASGSLRRDPAKRGQNLFLPPPCSVSLSMDPQAAATVSFGHYGDSDGGWRFDFAGALPSIAEAQAIDPRTAPVFMRFSEVNEGMIQFIAEGFRQ